MKHPTIRYSPGFLASILAKPCAVVCKSPVEARRLRDALYRRQRSAAASPMVIRMDGSTLFIEPQRQLDLEVKVLVPHLGAINEKEGI